MPNYLLIIAGCLLVTACGTQPVTPSSGHIQDEPRPAGLIPQTVRQTVLLPPPKPAAKTETYSVVVNDVPARELLFALARDAKLNIDVHPGIEGNITLNAIDQSLPQLLTRIARQVDMRYEIEGPNLTVLRDTPYLKQYKVDYLNMSRETTSNVSIATQIASAGRSSVTTGGTAATTGGAANSNSTTSLTNTSKNHFWQSLVQNLKDILHETDKLLPEGSSETTVEQAGTQSTTGTGVVAAPGRKSSSSAVNTIAGSPNPALLVTDSATVTRRSTFREAASVIANPENGIIAVRATSRQHEKVQEFIDQILATAKRQVLIEATVAEVQLSDQYQQGINWSTLRTGSGGFSLTQAQVGTTALPSGINPGTTPGLFVLNYAAPNSRFGNLSATIQLLESFGKVKVLSSPKISVLNNQTALLKVVDNRVYFTITAQTTPSTVAGVPPITTFSSDVHTVPIGFVMSVTPQIADTDEITLNIRPTISRIIGYVNDPNPDLANAATPVISRIPEIQTREMESMLKVSSGQIAVMGGLMQDSVNYLKDEVPGLSRLPLFGDIFSYRNETTTKTELVIFLRPVVVKDASMNGDYRNAGVSVPGANFFNESPPSQTAQGGARP
jgi:general secretion pathway protein D